MLIHAAGTSRFISSITLCHTAPVSVYHIIKELLRTRSLCVKVNNTMPFTLTKEYIDSFLGPAARGDWGPFLEAIDRNVQWIVNDPVYNSTSLTGTYVHPPTMRSNPSYTILESSRMARDNCRPAIWQISPR
jgi:hypothetical protein